MNKNKKIKLAVFDIDGTIFRSSLLIEYVEELVRAGIFPKKALLEINDDHKAWLDRKSGYDKYINEVVAVHLRYIDGVDAKKVASVVKKVITNLKDRNYRYTIDLIKKLKKRGYYLITISGSPHHVVEPFAKYLGFNDLFGSLYEIKNQKFTNTVIKSNSIFDKTVVVSQWAKQKGFIIDYKNSYAVGDSEGDISMLSKVGNPIAFNPSSALADVAKKKGWPIVVERKDVIYDISSCKLLKL